MAYTKLYTRINWENTPSTATPLAEINLNAMDIAIDGLDNRTLDLDARATNLEGYEPRVAQLTAAAAQSAADSATSATSSSGSATLSESYAKGGTNTRTGEDTDNSKYYKEQTQAIAESITDGAYYKFATKTEAEASASTLPNNALVAIINDRA